MDQTWEDVKVLLACGVELNGKSLVRLKWDLDQELHKRLAAILEADAGAMRQEVAASAEDAYLELLSSTAKRGYSHIPQAENLLATLREKDNLLREQQRQIDELRREVATFGNRRKRYLKRFARQRGIDLNLG